MALDRDTADLLAIAGSALGAVGLGVGAVASLQLARMKRAYAVLQGDGPHGDFISAVNRHTRQVEQVRDEVEKVERTLSGVQGDLSDALRHVAVVRYDAFPDMGGRLSFSVALLDDGGDGIVFTSINGRSETRTYAKGVKAGASEQPLSPEETQVIGYARR